MSLLSWSREQPPRFFFGDVLLGRYIVSTTVKSGRVSQMLYVDDRITECALVVKAVNRAAAGEKRILEEIDWLGRPDNMDGRRANLLRYHQDNVYTYFVFLRFSLNLEEVLHSETYSKMSKRHVREVTAQVLRAVSWLHVESIRHTDICPAHIEFQDNRTIQEFVYTDDEFEPRVSLACTKITLSFYGCIGLGNGHRVGTDQYRAPEVVFGWGHTRESDIFSIGCVMAEMITGEALFLARPGGPQYQREKAMMFDAVLGHFPSDLRQKIYWDNPGILKFRTSEFPEVDHNVAQVVREFVSTAVLLEDLIVDTSAFEVLQCLLELHSDRLKADDILLSEYFDTEY